MATAFGIGSQLNPGTTLSPFGNQSFGTFPGQGIGAWQSYGSPLQQILQSLQNVPYQLQQLQQQLLQLQQLQYLNHQQVQQLLQIVPAQLQQLQQVVQFIPQQIQQMQPQAFGSPLALSGGSPFQASTINPFAGQSGPVM
jgi:hypothetical protein